MKPILITATREERAEPYALALVAAGVAAESLQVISETHSLADVAQLATGASGLLLSGGPDVAPERYGEKVRLNNSVRVREKRDAIEWALLAGAQAAEVPVFAVCRGMQLVNVYLGGTLFQDLPAQLPEVAEHDIDEPLDHPAHTLRDVVTDLPLGRLLGGEPSPVNSRHHQAIRDLGRGLQPVAWSPDGVLEAVQLPPQGWWLWG
ncbi:MAG: gamma-glutamyl-gamma-aminobutyrate hydrolase family protein, partial [Thermoanaerobaculia bacterium]